MFTVGITRTTIAAGLGAVIGFGGGLYIADNFHKAAELKEVRAAVEKEREITAKDMKIVAKTLQEKDELLAKKDSIIRRLRRGDPSVCTNAAYPDDRRRMLNEVLEDPMAASTGGVSSGTQ